MRQDKLKQDKEKDDTEKRRREEKRQRKKISSGTFCKFSAGADEVIVEVIVCVVCKS